MLIETLMGGGDRVPLGQEATITIWWWLLHIAVMNPTPSSIHSPRGSTLEFLLRYINFLTAGLAAQGQSLFFSTKSSSQPSFFPSDFWSIFSFAASLCRSCSRILSLSLCSCLLFCSPLGQLNQLEAYKTIPLVNLSAIRGNESFQQSSFLLFSPNWVRLVKLCTWHICS